MRALKSALAVLVVLGLVACGGKSGEDGRSPARAEEGDEPESDAGSDAGAQASEADGENEAAGEDSDDGASGSGTEPTFAEDCSEGEEDCPCYPNATCNDELACVAGRCIEADEGDAPAGEPRTCSDAERGTLGCECYGNDTCNGTLICVADTCQSDEMASSAGGAATSSSGDTPPSATGASSTDSPPGAGEPIDTDGDGIPDAVTMDPDQGEPGTVPSVDPGTPATPTSGGGMVAPPGVPPPMGGPDAPPPGMVDENGEPIEVDGLEVDESCQPLHVSVGRDSCGLELECDAGWVYSSCWQDSGEWYCDCQSESHWLSLVMENGSSTDACAQTANLCVGGVEPEFTEDPMCSTEWETADESYCEQQLQCSQTADLGDGVSATLNEWQYSWCSESAENVWGCYCYTNNIQVQFEMPGEDSELVCGQAIDICADAASAEPEGPVECERTYQSAGPSYCSAEIGCTQDATVNGVTVGMYGSIWTNCEDAGDGSYTCYCQSGSDSAEFEVESDDAWATCSEAVESCRELVEVQIGSGGGGIGIGRPIPVDY